MLFPAVAIALLADLPILAGPAGDEVLLEADRIDYEWEASIFWLEGHVVVRRGDGELRAASGVYDRGHQKLRLLGGVLGVQGRQVFLAEGADVDLAARTADLASAVVFLKERAASIEAPRAGKNALTLHGSSVRQIGRGIFEAYDVRMTPCDCAGDPDYELTARKARIEGDVASLESPRMDLFGATIPLFPLSLPLTNRHSGLLAPQLGFTGQTGFGYAQPIFLTLGPSFDTTVTPGFFTGMGRTHNPALGARSLRGPRLGLELRYAPVEGTTGSVGLDLFDDLDQSDSPGGRGFSGVRGVLHASHRTEASPGIFALDGAWVSDTMFLADTQPAGIDRSTDVLRADAGFWRARGPLTLGLDASLLEDLRIENAALPDRKLVGADARATLQRLPAAFVQLAPVGLGGFTVAVEASAAQFVALKQLDPVERATGFGPTDLGAGAAIPVPDPARKPVLRLDASPRLAVSGPASLPIELRLEAGARADAWLIEGSPELDRTRLYGLFGARASLPLERAYGARLHRLEPAVEVRALSRPFRGGADPIGDPADGGGASWSQAPGAAQQGLGADPANGILGVPSARRGYDEIDGAAPSTGAVQAAVSLAQSLWQRGGRSAQRIAQLDLRQDVLLWADGTRARIGETSAALSFQAGPALVGGLVRYDFRSHGFTAVAGSASARDARGDEAHLSASLLRASTASEQVRAGADELFATTVLAVAPGELSGAAWTGFSGPIPLGRAGMRVAYDLGHNLGFVRQDAPTWTHRLSASIETPCRCAAVGLSIEAPIRDGKLLNGPVVHFVLDLKSLGSFATF